MGRMLLDAMASSCDLDTSCSPCRSSEQPEPIGHRYAGYFSMDAMKYRWSASRKRLLYCSGFCTVARLMRLSTSSFHMYCRQ